MQNLAKTFFTENNISVEMIELMPINIMYCDLDLKLRFFNKKSFETLKKIEHLLPIKVEQLINVSIDQFHKNPAHQRKLLSDPKNLPIRSIINLGDQYLDLFVNAVYTNGQYSGVMVTWDIITEKQNMDFVISALDKSQAMIEFSPSGEIITANENFLKAMGYSLKDIIGKHHRLFCEPNYVKSSEYEMFWKQLNLGIYSTSTFLRIDKNGKNIWLQATYNPIMNKDGKVIKVIKFATDVSKTKNDYIQLTQILTESSHQLAAASEEFTATANQLFSNAKKTNEQSLGASTATEEVDSGVRSVAANMEEMTASIREITKTTNEASLMASDTLKKSEATNKIINQLGASSLDIGNVVKVINSIAQQTNLLALNATIEAARAGDSGRGFAVVASEVKELAKQTAKATNDISKKIEAIQKETTSAVSAIGEISLSISKVNGHAGNIAAAVEEQAATTNEISRIIFESSSAIGGVSNLIREVSSTASVNSSDATQLIDASKGLSILALELKDLVKRLND